MSHESINENCDGCNWAFCHNCHEGFECTICGNEFCENCKEDNESECDICESVCKECHLEDPCKPEEKEAD